MTTSVKPAVDRGDWRPAASDWLLLLVPFVVLGLLFLGAWLVIRQLNGGAFTYASDDAYIHLALAENIARGHYGINLAETSAPASSILWPLLLAPFALLGIDLAVPLILNLLLSFATLLVAGWIAGVALAEVDPQRRSTALAVLLLALIPALNLVGLAFIGMEHSLQVFLALVLVAGLVRESRTGTVAWWLLAAIVLGPLVRYESLALSLPALAYLAWQRHFKALAVATAALALGLGAFTLFLAYQGLGVLPTSVVAKSPVIASGGGLSVLVGRLGQLLGTFALRQAAVLLVGCLFLLWVALFRDQAGDRRLASWALAAAALHLAFGTFSIRHESAILATVLLTLIYLYRTSLTRLIQAQAPWRVALFAAAVTAVLFGPYLSRILRTPLAANDIYLQQYQMHRLAAEAYGAPVAVNDLGYVAYGNPHYVLDLVGLASREALARRRSQGDLAWVNDLAEQHGVRLAMLYAGWFPGLPENWVPVGDLTLEREPATVAGRTVTVYGLDPQSVEEARALLLQFQETLPPGVSLTLR